MRRLLTFLLLLVQWHIMCCCTILYSLAQHLVIVAKNIISSWIMILTMFLNIQISEASSVIGNKMTDFFYTHKNTNENTLSETQHTHWGSSEAIFETFITFKNTYMANITKRTVLARSRKDHCSKWDRDSERERETRFSTKASNTKSSKGLFKHSQKH